MASDRTPPRLNPIGEALDRLEQERRQTPEPSLEQLRDHARGQLNPDQQAQVDHALEVHPHLREVVEALRSPNPDVKRGIEKGRQHWLALQRRAREPGTGGQRRQRRPDPWKTPEWWRLARPAVVVIVLFVALRVVPLSDLLKPSSEQTLLWLGESSTQPSDLRSKELSLQLKPGEPYRYALEAPAETAWLTVIKVEENEVSLHRQTGVSEPDWTVGALIPRSDGSLTRLVYVFSDAPLAAEEIVARIRASSSPSSLVLLNAGDARDSIFKNLEDLDRSALGIGISERFQAEQEP